MEISRPEYWSGQTFPSLGNLPRPRIEPVSPALAGRFSSTPGKSQDSLRIEYFQFQVILFVGLFCYLMGTLFRVKSETESHLHLFATLQAKRPGILQARILEWVAFPFSRGSSQPRDQTQVSCIAGRFSTS